MKDKLAKGVVWLVAAKAVVNLLGLLSTLLLARLLTPEDFGLVALATTILTIFGSLSELSMGSALIHHSDPTEAHFQTALTLNVGRALAVGVLFAAGAPLAARFYHDPRLVGIMLALGVSVVVAGFYNPKTVVLTRRLVFWQEFALTVTQKFAAFAVGVTTALIYRSYWALIAGIMASQVVSLILSYVIVPFRPKFSLQHARELWSFSVWLALAQIINTVHWKIDSLLVGTFSGRSALGFYSVGDNLAGMPTREAIGPLEATLFPGFAHLVHDNGRLQDAYQLAQSMIAAIALPIGFGCALIAHPLVLLAMGQKWLPVVRIIQVLACIYALQTLTSPAQPLAMAKGVTRLLFRRDLLGFVIRVPIIVAGMFLGGVPGIIYARGISTLIGNAINMFLVRHLIGLGVIRQISFNNRSFLSLLVMSVGVAAMQLLLGNNGPMPVLMLKLGVYIATGALLYVATHVALWQIAGRPVGAETEILRLSLKVRNKGRRFMQGATP